MSTFSITASLLIYVLLCVMAVQAVTFTDIQRLNISCSERISCNRIPQDAKFEERNCECDQLCSFFDDCCLDARSSNRHRNMGLTCMAYSTNLHLGAYVVNKCPERYAGPIAIKNKCEIEDDVSDPLASAPCTSLPIGITYRNRYCAECNKAKVSTLIPWEIGLTCDSLDSYELNGTFVWSNIEYRADLSGWGIEFQRQFHFCDLVYEKPENLTSSKVRLCRAGIVSTCPTTWRDSSVKNDCKAYTAVLYVDGKAYKNPHCAYCNRRSITNLNCVPPQLSVTHRRRKPFSFPMLVDVNRSNGDIVGEVQRCPSEEVYDPFFKKCRVVRCVIPGYTKVNGNCVKI